MAMHPATTSSSSHGSILDLARQLHPSLSRSSTIVVQGVRQERTLRGSILVWVRSRGFMILMSGRRMSIGEELAGVLQRVRTGVDIHCGRNRSQL